MLAAGGVMRGLDLQTGSMFSYVSPEALVPPDHPLRPIRVLVNRALERLSGEFDKLYAAGGGDSIAPEKLLRALLVQAFYSVRSERRLMEQVTYNMLLRWFVGLSMDAPVWDVTVFTKNRDRLLRGEVAGKFFGAVLAEPEVKPLLSSEHFSVDGTLIEAWASMKSFRPKDGWAHRPALAATASATSTARRAATRRTPRPRTRMRGWRGSRTARPPSSAMPGMW
jgi:transposase